ncbi:hypothetical protein [Sulfurimonas sp.]|uniref:hypothetical protein n=1 Tax=Sulfurimonas sp. TaxID=2022749 RepID=UPI0019DCE40F|nr:hypothetical protein [Sulfurimonas sp.]MBE0514026.1 hypothetical protein [Sulfurimonas sp.]
MKHIELLKLLHENRELIDRAYRQEFLQNVEPELVDSTLFVKISDRYKLNKNYLNFVDSVLQRIDYSIIFGDYEKEYKELVKNKKRFQERADAFYKSAIMKLIDDLYFKFYNRDREIQILLLRLENDTSLDIDILLENAADILEKIDELIGANQKIGAFFRKDLRGLDSEIDTLLQNISVNILYYIQNINTYIKEINQFIIQTKKRRIQNKQIIKLSNMILDEDVNALDEYLSLHYKNLYFSVERSQKNRIHSFASDDDIVKMKKELKSLFSNIVLEKPVKTAPIKMQAKEKLEIVDIQKILKDLQAKKSDDIFLFIKSHGELERFTQSELINEAFKVYLQITTNKQVMFGKCFNEFGIKVAQWQ